MNAAGWLIAALLVAFLVFSVRRAGWAFGIGVTSFAAAALCFSLGPLATT